MEKEVKEITEELFSEIDEGNKTLHLLPKPN